MVPPVSADLSAPSRTLVRVTVVGGTRRIDLAVSAAVPVVSMVADLTRLLGMGSGDAHFVATTTGSALDPSLGLRTQGIEDGTVLILAPVREHVPTQIHDDLVEAVHCLSRTQFTVWSPRSAAVASYVASAWSLGLGALVLTAVGVLHPQDAMVAAVVAGAGALGLLLAVARRTATLDTARGRDLRSVVAVWFASLYAALAAALVGSASPSGSVSAVGASVGALGPMLLATLAALGAAGVGCILLRRGRLLVAPVVGLGGTVLSGALLEASGWMAVHHWMVVVVTVWVLAARVAPGFAMDATALRGNDGDEDVAGVDTGRLRTDLVASHDMVLAVSLTATGLLLVVVPSALGSGVVGLLWLLALLGVLALRLRRTRLHAHVGAGLGGVGLVATSVVAWAPHLPAALVVVLAGTLLVAGVFVGMTEGRVRSVRAGWLGDRAEVVLTAAAVPLGLLVVWPGLMPGG